MQKYRLQRQLIGPAYTADSMKYLEDSLDEILEKDIQTTRERVCQSVDVDIFFNMFASGQYFVHVRSLGLMDYRLSLNSNFLANQNAW